MDDVLVVVVTQATAQLLVVHFGFVLALTPSFSHLHKRHMISSLLFSVLYMFDEVVLI